MGFRGLVDFVGYRVGSPAGAPSPDIPVPSTPSLKLMRRGAERLLANQWDIEEREDDGWVLVTSEESD